MRLPFCLAPVLAFMATPLLAAPPAVLREQRQVVVDGVKETWRLVWRGRPKEGACSPRDLEDAQVCPCESFAYAQEGALILERRRPGAPVERLPLAPFFTQAGLSPSTSKLPAALLQRWPMPPSDIERRGQDDTALRTEIRARRIVSVMRPADYNHDGIAGEFLLPMGHAACGHGYAIAVGVTRDQPHLHALTSVDHPSDPLILQVFEWEALARSPHPAPILDWQCDDHGDDKRTMLTLSADHGRIHAARDTYTCPSQDSADKQGFHPRHLTHEAL